MFIDITVIFTFRICHQFHHPGWHLPRSGHHHCFDRLHLCLTLSICADMCGRRHHSSYRSGWILRLRCSPDAAPRLCRYLRSHPSEAK